MWEPIWASRFRYCLLTANSSRSCLHSSRTRRVCTLNIRWWLVLWVYVIWCTEGCSESRIWSRTWWGVSKWSRHKNLYIGRLHSDIGMVRVISNKFRVLSVMYRRPRITRVLAEYADGGGVLVLITKSCGIFLVCGSCPNWPMSIWPWGASAQPNRSGDDVVSTP